MEEGEGQHAGRKPMTCAVCKYQRKKCDHNCIFAPYFPQGTETQFNNALKLYGVGKISKMINDTEPHLRVNTMKAVMYEADMRAADPVGGCYALIQRLCSDIRDLSSHIQKLSAELDFTRQQLALFRESSSSSSSHPQSQELPNVVDPNSVDIHSVNREALQEEIRNRANSLPVLRPLTLEDNKEEEEDDEKHVVLDLIDKIK